MNEADLHAAAADAHRLEVVLLLTRIERLTALIREHGIPLPTADDPLLGVSDSEHLAASRRVVTAAYDVLERASELEAALDDLRSMIGSGMELVGGGRWR